ncbi:MAG TPA: histidine phosphatase family protein [Caulobacteraceae bacterium]|jgi:probable phosphoglycerate mutase|nr:histidine phosphatase family protein [Caulobacteraceae bacterium]
MELILVRHGLPERRADTSDPPLSAVGHEQAQRVARHLGRERIDVVYASTMLRAVQTAEPFAAAGGHEILTREGIVEFDRGSGAYIPMEELKREDYAAWRAMATGDHGVDIGAFQAQVIETLEEIIAANSGKSVAVFCHGGVVNVWTAHVLGFPARLFFQPVYASLHRYLCARSGERNVVSLNERHHLED